MGSSFSVSCESKELSEDGSGSSSKGWSRLSDTGAGESESISVCTFADGCTSGSLPDASISVGVQGGDVDSSTDLDTMCLGAMCKVDETILRSNAESNKGC